MSSETRAASGEMTHDPQTGSRLQLVGLEEPRDMPDRPTDAPRGTAERVQEYARRAAAGMHLYHPEDTEDGVLRRTSTETMRQQRRCFWGPKSG